MTILGLNHIALKAKSVPTLTDFYTEVLGLEQIKQHHDDKVLRSNWLKLHHTILMIERSELGRENPALQSQIYDDDAPGIHLLAFGIEESAKDHWRKRLSAQGIAIEKESAFTIYFFDPEGNRVGLSSYAE